MFEKTNKMTDKKELKTLKDIERHTPMYEVDEELDFIDSKELKAEAINWAQYFKEHSKADGYELFAEDWVINFFNITKEDLK